MEKANISGVSYEKMSLARENKKQFKDDVEHSVYIYV